ncbi:hypothetical protein AB0880_17875 [Micromonospora chersina]|uniref:MmyB family transcriptional regulator n=1 Tax=Micromonospora chersina TaxID=47854 RepID=UPI0034550019
MSLRIRPTDTPAFVQGRYADVLYANSAATALSPLFAAGVNVLRAVFLDPASLPDYLVNENIVANCRGQPAGAGGGGRGRPAADRAGRGAVVR